MEDFPLAEPGAPIRMGALYPIGTVSRRIRDRAGVPPGLLICGNCVFDIADELDDQDG
jgi:hypothetical protein